MPTTIYDIAREAGVSVATVSRVLNAPQRVAPGTRQRVLDVIERRGFVPKADAVSRARRGVGRIGVLGPFSWHPAAQRRLSGILRAAAPDLEVVVYDQESAAASPAPLLATLPATGHLDGMVVVSLPLEETTSERLRRYGYPVVLLDTEDDELPSIVVDDEGGGRLVARHFADLGHERVGVLAEAQRAADGRAAVGGQAQQRHRLGDGGAAVGGRSAGDRGRRDGGRGGTEAGDREGRAGLGAERAGVRESPAGRRVVGFREELGRRDIELAEPAIRYAVPRSRQAVAEAMTLLRSPDPPTAIFASDDLLATCVLRAAGALGVRVPDQLSVVGFDDGELAETIGLTTVRQPLEASGTLAVRLLRARIADAHADADGETSRTLLRVRLTQRSTTGPAPGRTS